MITVEFYYPLITASEIIILYFTDADPWSKGLHASIQIGF